MRSGDPITLRSNIVRKSNFQRGSRWRFVFKSKWARLLEWHVCRVCIRIAKSPSIKAYHDAHV